MPRCIENVNTSVLLCKSFCVTINEEVVYAQYAHIITVAFVASAPIFCLHLTTETCYEWHFKDTQFLTELPHNLV